MSRLLAALQHLGKVETKAEAGPVVVTVFDKDRIADYQQMVASLRNAGIRAELYLGSGKFGPQMKYADRRNAPCVVIQGSDEKAKGEVTIKDLIVGAELAKLEKGREEHLQKRPRRSAPCRRRNWSKPSARCWPGTGFEGRSAVMTGSSRPLAAPTPTISASPFPLIGRDADL